MRFSSDGDESTVVGEVTLDKAFAGPPGAVHGGVLAGLFDEVCKSISRGWLDYLKKGVGDKIGIDAAPEALMNMDKFQSVGATVITSF